MKVFGKAVPSNLQQLEQVKEWEGKICRCCGWPNFLNSCISQGERGWIFLVGISVLYYNIQKIDLHVQFSAWMNLNTCARSCMNIIDFLFSVDHILFLSHWCIFFLFYHYVFIYFIQFPIFYYTAIFFSYFIFCHYLCIYLILFPSFYIIIKDLI